MLLQYIAKHSERYGFGWEKIADALDRISLGDLATRLRSKYGTCYKIDIGILDDFESL